MDFFHILPSEFAACSKSEIIIVKQLLIVSENFQIDEVPARAEAEEQSERNCFSSSFNRDDHDEKLVSLFGEGTILFSVEFWI